MGSDTKRRNVIERNNLLLATAYHSTISAAVVSPQIRKPRVRHVLTQGLPLVVGMESEKCKKWSLRPKIYNPGCYLKLLMGATIGINEHDGHTGRSSRCFGFMHVGDPLPSDVIQQIIPGYGNGHSVKCQEDAEERARARRE